MIATHIDATDFIDREIRPAVEGVQFPLRLDFPELFQRLVSEGLVVQDAERPSGYRWADECAGDATDGFWSAIHELNQAKWWTNLHPFSSSGMHLATTIEFGKVQCDGHRDHIDIEEYSGGLVHPKGSPIDMLNRWRNPQAQASLVLHYGDADQCRAAAVALLKAADLLDRISGVASAKGATIAGPSAEHRSNCIGWNTGRFAHAKNRRLVPVKTDD